MVPKDWVLGYVGDLLIGLESGVSVNGQERCAQPGEKAVLKVSAVSYGCFDSNAAKVIDKKEISRAKTTPRAGQIIISRSNTEALVGASAYVDKDYQDIFLPDKLWQTIPKPDANMKWLSYVLASEHVRYTLSKLATGTSGSMKNITKGELLSLKILIPPRPEQKKIARILSTWDKAIANTEQLLFNKKQQKKSLMQQLLTGQKRFPEFSGEWIEIPLSKIFHRVMKKNSGCSTNVVTISGQQGLIRQDEFFKKNIASEILDDYFLIKKGQFAYNKSYSIGYPMGAIKRLNRYELGVVTTLYICFELSDFDIADSDYFEHYFESGLLNKGLTQIAHEGGRAHGLLNVKPSDFFSLNVFLPSIAEQKKIAGALTTADCEIKALKQKLHYLKQEKKALMQQLLTGKRRVKVDPHD
ncbi:restriction endonuclease subunit S [Serratia plymuthica]|uniref:restriction endonuclease subunit S n=1 Tax=Serratia plymuthica TaxID=82996 RepID=UPI0009360ADB|nr:restriction endonuclease subunit S [Serratia plymuthica]OJT44520.1 hypothetical protein BSR04_04835 [Serratia plymuthica]